MSDANELTEVAFRMAGDLEVRCFIGLVSSSPIIGPPRPKRSGEMVIGLYEGDRVLDRALGLAWQVRPVSPEATSERDATFEFAVSSSVQIRLTVGINLSSPISGPEPTQYGTMSFVLEEGVELSAFYVADMLAQSSVIVGPPPGND